VRCHRCIIGALVLLSLAAGGAGAQDDLVAAVDRVDLATLRAMGPRILEQLPELYRTGDRKRKIAVARVWYGLGWVSEDAKEALLEDLDSQDPGLRLDVQWALGRVSSDPQVVRRLLATMRDDPNPLFRDKAACALASDQIHLSPGQRAEELEGLVDSLSDPKPQVRAIAIQALRILTGQDKGFRPMAAAEERAQSVEQWRRWLDAYRAAL